MISTVLLAEDMGLEPEEPLVFCCLVLFRVGAKMLKFQGFEAVRLAVTVMQEM